MSQSRTHSPVQGQDTTNKDNGMRIFLLVCGILGAIFMQYCIYYNTPAPPRNDGTVVTNEEKQALTPVVSTPAQFPEIKEDIVSPSYQPEAMQRLCITLEHSRTSSGVEYDLDLGDGTRKTFNKAGQLYHTYRELGEKRVILYGTFKGQRSKIQERIFHVAPALEIDPMSSIIDNEEVYIDTNEGDSQIAEQ